MFHRRRAASNPAPRTPPSAAASLAASQAFIRNRQSNASLSSAAAAAALRTHPPSSVPVQDVVTKRMMRKASTSSTGSGNQRPQGLQRRGSSGSMTERSFRAPSPNRSSPVVELDSNAPPVPRVPAQIPEVGVAHRRAASLDPPFSTSSPPRRGGGRGTSLDRGGGFGRGRGRPLSQVPENAVDTSPRSINFSRPISPPQSSTPTKAQSPVQKSAGWFTAPVVNEGTFRGGSTPQTNPGIDTSGLELSGLQQSIHSAANRPVSHRKSKATPGVEASRLAAGTMGVQPSGSAVSRGPQLVRSLSGKRYQPVDPKSTAAVYDPSSRRFISKQEAMDRLKEGDQYEDVHEEYPRPQKTISPPQSTSVKPAYHAPHIPSPPTVHRHFAPVFEPTLPQDDYLPSDVDESRTIPPAQTRDVVPTALIHQRPPTPPPEAPPSPPPVLPRKSSENFGEADQVLVPSLVKQADAPASKEVTDDFEDSSVPQPISLQEKPYPKFLTPGHENDTSSSEVERRSSVRSQRTQSLSPPRSAHFADITVELAKGTKHVPPPRSVSPAKSALKHSASVAQRSGSPVTNNDHHGYRSAVSETSETMSEDGMKKKKKTRVSFEEEPVVAGTSAYEESTKPSLPSLHSSRWSSEPPSHEQNLGLDDVLKPRPALPSFGSVRDRNRRDYGDKELSEKDIGSVSASPTPHEPLEPSSDLALGGIVAHDFASKQKAADSQHSQSRFPMEPLPPEVTSVEGTGYGTDSDQSEEESSAHNTKRSLQHGEEAGADFVLPEPEPKTLTKTVEISKRPEQSIPDISILPATPKPADTQEDKFEGSFSVPGGWTGPNRGAAEATIPEAEAIPGAVKAPHQAVISEDSSEDESSIYSDAYEDLPESDHGEFPSIDAVVEKVISVPVATGIRGQSIPPSNAVSAEPIRPPVAATSSLVHSSDESDMEAPDQLHRNIPSTITPTVPVPESPRAPAVSKQAVRKPETRLQDIQPKEKVVSASVKPSPPKSSSKPLKPALKKSPAAQERPPKPSPMKRTMRNETSTAPVTSAEPRLRKSMRSDEGISPPQASRGLAASRYSLPPKVETPRGTLQKKSMPTSPAQAKSNPRAASLALAKAIAATPTPVPAPQYDSDSDASASSFVRQRPRRSQKGGGFAMRSTMRDASMRPAPTLRPTSPPVSAPSPARSTPPTIRKTLRSSSPPSSPPAGDGLRSSRFSLRSLSPAGRFSGKKISRVESPPPLPTQSSRKSSSVLPSFGKSSKAKEASIGSRFKSRIEDSSDEEDVRPRRFQSRFADSDSEEELPPVRGIPKRPGEEDGDSTDLEDEDSDAERFPSGKREVPDGAITNGASGRAVKHASFAPSLLKSKHASSTPPLEPVKPKSRRGFFGLGKKKKVAADEPKPEPTAPQSDSADIPLPPPLKNSTLAPIGEEKDIEAGISTSSPGKLQRRSAPMPSRSTSDSWPLPAPTSATADDGRPQTSEGLSSKRTSLRPRFGKRHSTMSEPSVAPNGVDDKDGVLQVGKNGKKKKFGKLRRAFGLYD